MNRSKGFTIAELAVATAIIALLLAGALIPLSTQIDVRNVSDTQRAMESIREAIIGFAQANGRLPCPADGSIPTGTTGAGTEQVAGNTCTAVNSAACTAVNGAIPCSVIPWVTLGVPETDSWGRRFSYRVSPVFADFSAASTWSTATTTTPASPGNQNPVCNPIPQPGPPTSFALCSLGDIAVFSRVGTSTTATPLGVAMPAAFISHGKNGLGGWQTNGTRLATAPVGDELANANGTTVVTPAGSYPSRVFYSRTPTPAAAGCTDPTPPAPSTNPLCEYDDIVFTISTPTLVARMVNAGKLP